MKRSSAKGTFEKMLRLASHLDRQEFVLDCPAGHGGFSRMLEQAAFSNIMAAEYDTTMFAHDTISVTACDLNKKLAFKDRFFGAVFCIDGLCEIDNVANALDEFFRVLKADGSLYISIPNVLNLRSRMRFLLTGFYSKYKYPFDEENGEPTHRILPYWEVRYLLLRSGFVLRGVHTNRYKPVNVALGILVLPLVILALPFGFFSAKARKKYKVIFSLLLPQILFGETLIVESIKGK